MRLNAFTPMVSLENEIMAWQLLVRAVDDALEKYPRTVEEDIELLEGNELEDQLSKNQKQATLFVRSEKMVLHFIKDCANLVF